MITSKKSLPILATVGLLTATIVTTTIPANAGSQVCGNYVLGGAFQSKRNAHKLANKIDGFVWDLDGSDSPNAGKGFWVVADGPFSISRAKRMVRNWKRNGAGGAYYKYMCFTGV